MKLLIITSLKEYLPDITTLLRQAQIEIFSTSKTTGIRPSGESDLLEDWFGSHSGEFDSIFLFSFTADDTAAKAISLVEAYNKKNDTGFPVKAFILSVEKSSQ